MSEGLCCCEYYNVDGDKSHILATCCDCEAVDTACDRCLRCQAVPDDVCAAVTRTFADRLRIPWCGGAGAIRLNPEVVVITTGVAGLLMLASLHLYLSVMSLLLLASCLVLRLRTWSRNKQRTTEFFTFGMVSTILMLLTFLALVLPNSKIAIWQVLLFLSLFALMIYELHQTRRDPGIIAHCNHRSIYGVKDTHCKEANHLIHSSLPSSTDHYINKTIVDLPTANSENLINEAYIATSTRSPKDHVASPAHTLNDNNNLDEKKILQTQDNVNQANHQLQSGNQSNIKIPLEELTWIDSRLKGQHVVLWCDDCQLVRPPRSGHCPVCRQCVACRDHHCLWLDCCIGGENHRSFVLTLMLFTVTGWYGAWLALASVCTTQLYGCFLLPTDCADPYSSFSSAYVLVSACYTLLVCSALSVLLVSQMLLISQNLTSQELHAASQLGWTTGCWAKHNHNNRGLVHNWCDFLLNGRARKLQCHTV